MDSEGGLMETVQILRHRSFLDSSLKLDGITAILKATSGELSYYTQIFITWGC